MSCARYLIAGLKVEMEVTGETLKKQSEKYRFDFDGEPDMVIIPNQENIRAMHEKYPSLTDDTSEYLGTGNMFYYRLLKFDGFLLHSSCIAYDDNAYIFTADSGTGKSTHTSLWKEYIDNVVTINDDKPAVRLIDGKFYCFGTPWSGKTDQSTNIGVPLKSVALLHRGTKNKIHPANLSNAVLFLMRQTIMPFKMTNTEYLMTLLDRFIRTIPIFHLECDMSEQAVITSFEAMTDKKYIKRK